MILPVFTVLIFFGGVTAIIDITNLKLEDVLGRASLNSTLDLLTGTVAELNKRIKSATFDVFLPHVSEEEFEQTHSGYKPRMTETSGKTKRSVKKQKKFYGSSAGVDLRKTGCLPKVRNQEDCACCYAFVFETALYYLACKEKEKNPTGYSVEEMAACTSGCNGGHMHDVWEYLQKKKGVCSESDYPYTGNPDGKCNTAEKKRYLDQYTIKFHGWPGNPFPKESDIKTELDKGYPLFVPISVTTAVRHYKTGFLTGEGCECKQNAKGEDVVNHIVVCVGYGTDPKWGDYWLLMNSWGPEWGDGGYMKIQRGVNCIGVASETSRIELKK